MTGRMRHVLLVPVALALVLVVAMPAVAGETIQRHGPCSAKSVYTVEFKKDFGPTLEVSAFVDSPAAGQAWHVHMRHNGLLFLSTLVTSNTHGNFELQAHHPEKRLMRDTLTVKAFNKVTGEVCAVTRTLS